VTLPLRDEPARTVRTGDTGPMGEDRAAGPATDRRVTDADRDEAIGVLRAATVDGSIDLDELAERIDRAYRARTAGELVAVTRDLPAAHGAGPSSPAPRRRLWDHLGFRYHAASWGLVNGFLVGVWALAGGGHPWPFYPAAGWGIALWLHAMALSTVGARGPAPSKQDRAQDRGRARTWHDRPQGGHRTGPRLDGLPARPPEPPPPPAWPTLRAQTANGHLPDPAAPHAPVERVAVLFTDIAGSTQLTVALGDVGWSQVRDRHRSMIARCVSEHGGREVNVAGDGILARFPTEVAAVRCAVGIQRALDQQRRETGFSPGVRIGVHAGEAVADGTDLVGHTINLAARVTAEAEPGEILVTEAVAERLGDRFPVEGRGLRHLKGLTQPRHLLAVDWS
jgi:class 3 adenylate cyclase